MCLKSATLLLKCQSSARHICVYPYTDLVICKDNNDYLAYYKPLHSTMFHSQFDEFTFIKK